MRKSQRSQDKSIYLAFALCPCISFENQYDRQSSQDRIFHFQLWKGNSIIQKTSTFGINSMLEENQMYLYLSLPQYAQKLKETYFIKLIDVTEKYSSTLFDQKINLNLYVHEHNTKERDFWTEIYKTSNETEKILLKQRVFLKRTKIQLQDIINSSQKGEQLDIVQIPEHSSTFQKSKFGVDRRKQKSYQTALNNLSSTPRRLDTISEEESNPLLTDRKQRESFGDKEIRLKKITTNSYQKENEDFESELLKKQSTWVDKNTNFDDEFITAFDYANQEGYQSQFLNHDENNLYSQFNKLRLKSTTQSEMSQKGSKISKNTKDSQKQLQDNSISFLDKSSLLMDMQQSQLSISVNQQICFKLKWIILVIIILSLAVIASLSTDAFDITNSDKHKVKSTKKKNQKNDKKINQKINNKKNKQQTNKNNNKHKHKRQIHI